jgi:(R,R)-butanediol dehydrogenase/meso-butanediol dehydrogenase/diacetyl reductase
MRSLRWHGREDVRVEDVYWETSVPSGEIEVEVSLCGICGSDLAEWKVGFVAIRSGPHPVTGVEPPITLGHEIAGRVVALGDAVPERAGLRVGDRVASDAAWRCQTCAECQAGRYNLCSAGASVGLASHGGMAERVRIPWYCAVPLPDGVSDQAGALLEPLAVGLHGLERGGARYGAEVVVVGFGPVGACTAEVGVALGMSVVVVEPHDGRRRRAQALGHATYAPVGDVRADARAVRLLLGSAGADVVIDCAGTPQSLVMSCEMARRGGSIVAVGIPKTEVPVDVARLILLERSLVGALGYRHHLPRVARLIADGRLGATRIVTSVEPLSRGPEVFRQLVMDPGDSIKVLLDPSR